MATLIVKELDETVLNNVSHDNHDENFKENWQVVPESHFELDGDFPCEELIPNTSLEGILWGELLTESKLERENITTATSPGTYPSLSRKRQLGVVYLDMLLDTIDSGCESDINNDTKRDSYEHQAKRSKPTATVTCPHRRVNLDERDGVNSGKCATCELDNATDNLASSEIGTCHNSSTVSTNEEITPKLHQQHQSPPPPPKRQGPIQIAKQQSTKPFDIAAFFNRVAIDCVLAETNTNTIIIGSTTTTTTIAINNKPSSDSVSPSRRRKIPYAKPKEEPCPTLRSSIYSCAPLPPTHSISPLATQNQLPKPLQLPNTLRVTPKSTNANCQFFLLPKKNAKRTTPVCNFFRPKTKTTA